MKRFYQIFIPSSFLVFILAGCAKQIECDHAQLCLKNNSADTIYFAFNSSTYEDTLVPGETYCQDEGHIWYDPNSGSGSLKVTELNSSKGNFFIDIDDCMIEKEFQ